MKSIFTLAVVFLIASACSVRQEKADLIIHNANIHTLDIQNSRAEALAVKNGEIIAVGKEREVMKRYQSAATVDARKNHVYPGLSGVIPGSDYDKNQLYSRGITYPQFRGVTENEAAQISSDFKGDDVVLSFYARCNSFRSEPELRKFNGVYCDSLPPRDLLFRILEEAEKKGVRPVFKISTEEIEPFKNALIINLEGVNDLRVGLVPEEDSDELLELCDQFTLIPEWTGGNGNPEVLAQPNGIVVATAENPVDFIFKALKTGMNAGGAINSVTLWPALADFRSENTGMIKKGFRADMITVNGEPDKLTPSRKDKFQILSTFVGGKKVYEHE